MAAIIRLVDRVPAISAEEIVAYLTPPPQFDHVSFENYLPDDNFQSQEIARRTLMNFAKGGGSVVPKARGGLFGRGKASEATAEVGQLQAGTSGVYLDGGFGVGKTHLLAALWHATSGRKYFGTFIQYTALVGALGYQKALETLRGAKLICIDEFELDDPGDTMIMTRLVGELADGGTRFAATSNTPPNALGEGRFAAADFLREIQAIADRFTILRIDGEDYRHRDAGSHAHVTQDELVAAWAQQRLGAGESVAEDEFGELITHLGQVHPSTFVRLISGVDAIALHHVVPLTSQTDALRFVAFIDRVYDAQIPIVASGAPLDTIFSAEMLEGGYRKKYQRCMSRLVALTTL